LISYALSWLQEGGIQDVAICANRETQAIQAYLHAEAPLGLTLSYHRDEMPRGAAGAVKDAAEASDADSFVVADGTAIPTIDLHDLLRAHRATEAAVTVVVHSEPSTGSPALSTPSGIYVFSRQALDVVPATGFYDIKENLIPQLHRLGARVVPYHAATDSPRVLNAASYLAVNEWMVERLVTTAEPIDAYDRSGSLVAHRTARISDQAMFVGPVLVGAGARIGAGAVVVGPTSIGRDAVLESGVLVSRSAIWQGAVIEQNAVVDRCLVGDNATISAHTEAFGRIATPVAARRAVPVRRPAAVAPAANQPLDALRRMGRSILGTAVRSQTAP